MIIFSLEDANFDFGENFNGYQNKEYFENCICNNKIVLYINFTTSKMYKSKIRLLFFNVTLKYNKHLIYQFNY